jgi:hypothetical protein
LGEKNISRDLREIEWELLTGFIWLRIGTSGGSCKHDYELSDSIKDTEFRD